MPPEGPIAGTQGTHALATTYDGASYVLRRNATMSRIIVRLTAVTAGAVVRVLVYQTTDGGAGNASKVGSVSSAALAAGAQTLTLVFSEGSVAFKAGLIYILVGKANATNATLRVYTSSAFDLLNQNVETTTHPLFFTTAISAAGADPATFNPLTDGTATTTDVAAIARMRA